MNLAERVLTTQGQQRLALWEQLQPLLEAAWKAQDLEQIQSVQGQLDELSCLQPGDLRSDVEASPPLQGAGNLRLTSVDGALRIRGDQSLDLRLQLEGDTLTIQGRRRPSFGVDEYLSARLDGGLE